MPPIVKFHIHVAVAILLFCLHGCPAKKSKDAQYVQALLRLETELGSEVSSDAGQFANAQMMGALALDLDASFGPHHVGTFGLAFGFFTILLSGLIAVVYRERGFFVVLSILSYVFALSSMSSMVRSIFTHFNFPFSCWVSATHFFCTALFSFLVLAVQSCRSQKRIFVPTSAHFIRGILPQALAMALSIGCANIGLTYANASFYEMFSSMSLLVTALLGTLLGKPLHPDLRMPLLWISIGLLVISKGDAKFSALGVLFIFLGILFRAFKVQIQGLLLSSNASFEKMEPLELAAWNGFTCFLAMAIWSACLEGMEPWRFLASRGTVNLCIMLFVCACAACALNTSSMFVLKELGPVAQQAVGQLKGIMACATAVLALGEVIHGQQILGYAVMICAIAWYNRIDQALKADQAVKAAQEPSKTDVRTILSNLAKKSAERLPEQTA